MYNGKAKVGYRLYDTVNKVIKDIATKSFMNGLAGGVKVDNVTVEAGSLKFTAGSEERYAKLDVGYNELGYRPLVVLAKNLKDKNYLVVDPMGNEKLMKESEIVYYANKYGVANAKVVDKHIASLSGSFKELNNIVLKRFVLIRYIGRRDALYEPSEAYYYDLKSDRVLSMREMAKEFGYHELLTRKSKGIYNTNSEEVYDVMVQGVVREVKTVYHEDKGISGATRESVEGFGYNASWVVINHSFDKSGKVKFMAVNVHGKKRYYDDLDLIFHMLNRTNEVGCAIYEDKGQLVILDSTSEYRCSKDKIAEAKEKYASTMKIKKKMELMAVSNSYLEISQSGELVRLELDRLKQNVKVVSLPKGLRILNCRFLKYHSYSNFSNMNTAGEYTIAVPASAELIDANKQTIYDSNLEFVDNQFARKNRCTNMSSLVSKWKYQITGGYTYSYSSTSSGVLNKEIEKHTRFINKLKIKFDCELDPYEYIGLFRYFGNVQCKGTDIEKVGDIVCKHLNKLINTVKNPDYLNKLTYKLLERKTGVAYFIGVINRDKLTISNMSKKDLSDEVSRKVIENRIDESICMNIYKNTKVIKIKELCDELHKLTDSLVSDASDIYKKIEYKILDEVDWITYFAPDGDYFGGSTDKRTLSIMKVVDTYGKDRYVTILRKAEEGERAYRVNYKDAWKLKRAVRHGLMFHGDSSLRCDGVTEKDVAGIRGIMKYIRNLD